MDAMPAPVDIPHETPERFISAMAKAATGVSVVATWGIAGRAARTISAFASISAKPPVVMVSVRDASPLTRQISANGVFSLSILSPEQRRVAELFGSSSSAEASLDAEAVNWKADPDHSALYLENSASSFLCDVSEEIVVGTHHLFFGLVRRAIEGNDKALIYHARAYAAPLKL